MKEKKHNQKIMLAMATNHQMRWLRNIAIEDRLFFNLQPNYSNSHTLYHKYICFISLTNFFSYKLLNIIKYPTIVFLQPKKKTKQFGKKPFIKDFYIEIMEIIAIILVSDVQFSAIRFNISFFYRKKRQSTKNTLPDDCLKFTRNIFSEYIITTFSFAT